MNQRKKVLWAGMLSLMIIGIGFLSVPFFSAMNPPANAGQDLPYIDISHMENGTYTYSHSEIEGWFGTSFLIIKKYNSEFIVYLVPTKNDAFVMPDLKWYRQGGFCKDFRPETIDGKIKPNGYIKCHDSDIPEWNHDEWLWTIDGRKLGKWTADMETIKFKLTSSYIIIGHG
jgi:hypothetical protein